MSSLKFDSSQVIKALQNIKKKVYREIGEKTLKEGAEPILNEMLRNVPVSKENGGQLKSSLQIGKITGSVADGNMKIKVGINPYMSEQVRYEFYQEYGTDVMLGKKWMKTSWDNSIKQSKEIIEETIK